MTSDTVAEAVYEIGQAAATKREAQLGGADLGRMLVAQIAALGAMREQSRCASNTDLELTLIRLEAGKLPTHAAVASAALDVLRRYMARP